MKKRVKKAELIMPGLVLSFLLRFFWSRSGSDVKAAINATRINFFHFVSFEVKLK